MRIEQANPVYLVGDISRQKDVEGIAKVTERLGSVVESLVSQDASADDIGRIVTAIGDAVERRLLALAEEQLGPPPVSYCWVSLGSRARLEQALASDQDNALILADDVQPEHAAYFEALAARRDRRAGPVRLPAVPRRGHGDQPTLATTAGRVAQ